ncbi:hypothetical protein P154DRAFT_586904 [Amniculicola lignicola CBS 123094]|uniref:Rhodopsin domain-containing protein n=1 Tax=Amniculicola lignicola CBS 123094 TaxID=1392246 RepID=A0A6A5VXF2_9PLEO|nr:hypothetical protein P154DRAFT_586904 [Amniculicola lignicola CBS 123094]
MATPTPEDIASWPLPNFENPESRGPVVIGLTVFTMVFAVLFTGVRFYGKGVLRTALGMDDWIMLGATVFSIPVSVMAIVSLKYGLGLHIWDQKGPQPIYYKMAFASDMLFPMACSLTKFSLCLTYLRLFPSRSNKIFCYGLSIFVMSFTVACIFLMLFQCTPIRGYWDPGAKQHCINLRVTLIIIAAFNSLSDFLVYLWPAKPLWSLQLPLKQRIGLVVIFAVGSTVCVAGICRIYYLEVYFESYDLLWVAAYIYAIMAVEMNLGIICGCLSGVKPVLAVLFPRFFASSQHSTLNTNGRTLATYGRSTHGHPESFAFQQLSNSKAKDQKFEVLDVDGGKLDTERRMANGQRNFAWASSSGELGEGGRGVPVNGIVVDQVVDVSEEQREWGTRGKGDAGSEEWIMDDGLEEKERTKAV